MILDFKHQLTFNISCHCIYLMYRHLTKITSYENIMFIYVRKMHLRCYPKTKFLTIKTYTPPNGKFEYSYPLICDKIKYTRNSI